LLVAALLPGTPPALNDPANDLRSFYVDNKGGIQAASYLTGLAAFFFVWFAASLRASLARAEGEEARVSAIVLGSSVLAVALALVNAAVNAVLAVRIAAESDQAVLRALYDLQAYTITLVAFPLALLVAAVSTVSLHTRFLPARLAWGGYALAVAWLVSAVALFEEEGFFSPVGAFPVIVFVAWLAWVLVLSLVLIRRLGSGVAAP
jgi:hypothetical protein